MLPNNEARKGSEPAKSVDDRLAVGALINVLLPLLIFTVMFMLPQEVELGRLTTTDVAPGSAAAEAGILPGDVLVAANGKQVENRLDLTREINLNGGSDMTVQLERAGQLEKVTLRPRFHADGSRWLAGVTVELADRRVVSRSHPIWEAVPESLVSTWELIVLLKQLVTGMVSAGRHRSFRGPSGSRRCPAR